MTFVLVVILIFASWIDRALAIQAVIDTTTYDAFGGMVRLPKGTLGLFYRQGTSHVGRGDYGILRMRTSSDEGESWSGATTILSEPNVDLRNLALGVSGGRIILFYARYNPDIPLGLSNNYIYSDNNGSTWRGPSILSTTTGPYGQVIAIGNGELLASSYDGKNNTFVNKSIDNGVTWGSPIKVISSPTVQYTEGEFVYLGNNTILGLVRKNNASTFQQVLSTDNGDTWSNQGATSFDPFTPASPPSLRRYGKTIGVFYANRQIAKMRVATANISDLISSGPSAWGSPTNLADLSTLGTGGYPQEVILTSGANSGKVLVYYYNEKSSSDADSSFVLFTPPLDQAPDTQITGSPLALTNLTSANFTFSSTQAGSTFACKLDTAPFSACSSPMNFSALAAGSHTFQVQATNPSGLTDPTPASFTLTIDLTPPDTSITSGPSGTIAVGTATFNWTGSDNITTPGSLLYAYRLDPVEQNFSAFGPATTKSYSNLSNGSYTFYVKSKDQASNEDLSPATQPLTINLPAGSPTVTLTFDGQVRDRVGEAELALAPDGKPDGVFTVTLNPGSGNRTVTRLQLTNSPGGVWNTQSPDRFWSLGVASGLDTPLLNVANDSVSFSLAEGSSFKIFAADWQDRMYLSGTVFTLTANFADGSTVTQTVTVP